MKVGVTGGTGFIGKAFLKLYSDTYDFIVTTSKKSMESTEHIRYCYSDYSMDSFLTSFQDCDAIVHLGARIPDSVTSAGSIVNYIENITSTENLLRAAVALKIRNFIDISSVSVYRKDVGRPFTEDMPTSPDNAYGIAKVTAELLNELYAKHYGLSTKTLRVGQVLGYRKYTIKGFYQMLQDNSFNKQAVTVFGTGKAARDYVYVKDVAYAIHCALLKPEIRGVFNIAMGTPTTNAELAEAFCTVFENPAGVDYRPVEREDERFWSMDISRARDMLGWQPQYSVFAMVEDICWEMKHSK